MKRITALFMGAFLMTGALSVAAPQKAEAACVVDVAKWDVLWIRSGPGNRYEKTSSMPAYACGIEINWQSCTGYKRRWCQVVYGGYHGWAYTRFLR